MIIMLADLVKDPGLLDSLRFSNSRLKNPNEGDHPMDECFDDYYEKISDLIESSPPVYSGVRRI